MPDNKFKAVYKRFNGTGWDIFHFATSATQVAESADNDRYFAQIQEKIKLKRWLETVPGYNAENFGTVPAAVFNTASNLALIGANGELPVGILPINSLKSSFLPLEGGTLTGNLDLSGNNLENVGQIKTNLIAKRGASAAELSINGYSKVNLNNTILTGVADPVKPFDGVNKSYVDMLSAQGTHLAAAVRAASGNNVPTLSGLIPIDGVNLAADDRVLLFAQTNTEENGVYIVRESNWVRINNDSDSGSLVSVLEGETYAKHQYYNKPGEGWVIYWVEDGYTVRVDGGLDMTGLAFGIKPLGVVESMIANNQVTLSKLGEDIDLTNAKFINFASSDDAALGNSTTARSLNDHLSNLYGMVKKVKGTAGAHTAQADNITVLRTDINTLDLNKNRTYVGSTAPTVDAMYRVGDIYLETI